MRPLPGAARPLTASPLVQTLPFVAWILVVALATGSFFFAALTAETTDATPGYLRFTAVMAAVFGFLAFLVGPGLTAPEALVVRTAPPDLDGVRQVATGLFALAAFAYGIVVARKHRRWAFGGLALLSGIVALVAAAFGLAPSAPDAVPFAVQLFVLSAVTGGSLSAIMLGHWYLVTPKISTRPLLLQTRWLLGAIVLQALLFVVWATLGGGVDQGAWEALSGPSALLVWLRGVVTVAFPTVLVYMALRTAQTRSMESATGLLYINFAAVLAGTIGAAALYAAAGILV